MVCFLNHIVSILYCTALRCTLCTYPLSAEAGATHYYCAEASPHSTDTEPLHSRLTNTGTKISASNIYAQKHKGENCIARFTSKYHRYQNKKFRTNWNKSHTNHIFMNIRSALNVLRIFRFASHFKPLRTGATFDFIRGPACLRPSQFCRNGLLFWIHCVS